MLHILGTTGQYLSGIKCFIANFSANYWRQTIEVIGAKSPANKTTIASLVYPHTQGLSKSLTVCIDTLHLSTIRSDFRSESSTQRDMVQYAVRRFLCFDTLKPRFTA